MRPLIDDCLPEYDEREFHSKEIAATPAAVERAVRALKPGDLPLTRLLMGLRTLPALLTGRRLSARASQPLLDGIQSLGFVILEERAGEQIVLGVAGRFWRPRGDGIDPLEDPQAFRGYDRPGSVRAAWVPPFRWLQLSALRRGSAQARVACGRTLGCRQALTYDGVVLARGREAGSDLPKPHPRRHSRLPIAQRVRKASSAANRPTLDYGDRRTLPVTPLDDVISSTLKRNWRGNHKEAALRGRDDDPFVYTIDDVYARVWADRSGARTSMETFLSVSEEATGMTLLG